MKPQPEADAARWFASRAGREILAAEARVCAQVFREIYGSVGLMLRLDGVPIDLLSDTQLVSGFALDVSLVPRVNRPIVSRTDALPIHEASIKLLIVHHVHELVDSTLLVELVRLIAPGGLLALAGLNPVGRRLRWSCQPGWVNHWRHAATLRRELKRSGMSPVATEAVLAHSGGYRKLAARLQGSALGGVSRLLADGYLLVMKKREEAGRIVSARTLINRSGQRVSNAAPSAGMRPANADR